jgi:hypothetical protein
MRHLCLVGISSLLVLGLIAPSSAAQSERSYVLGESVSFDAETTQSLEKEDFVPGLEEGRRSTGELVRLSSTRGKSAGTQLNVLPRSNSTTANVIAPIGLGVVGGAAGLFGGGIVGVSLSGASNCDSFCGLGYMFYGALIGETVGLSSGVYLGTERRGSYLLTLLGGALGTAGVIALASQVDGPALLVAGPAVQLAVTIPIARSSW